MLACYKNNQNAKIDSHSVRAINLSARVRANQRFYLSNYNELKCRLPSTECAELCDLSLRIVSSFSIRFFMTHFPFNASSVSVTIINKCVEAAADFFMHSQGKTT